MAKRDIIHCGCYWMSYAEIHGRLHEICSMAKVIGGWCYTILVLFYHDSFHACKKKKEKKKRKEKKQLTQSFLHRSFFSSDVLPYYGLLFVKHTAVNGLKRYLNKWEMCVRFFR